MKVRLSDFVYRHMVSGDSSVTNTASWVVNQALASVAHRDVRDRRHLRTDDRHSNTSASIDGRGRCGAPHLVPRIDLNLWIISTGDCGGPP